MLGDPVSIFISYARKDEAYMQELVSHLEPLQRGGLISSWHDGQILPGEEWANQIKQNLETAQIILLLISKDFLNSDYCYEIELAKAIERHKTGKASVIPVILRSCLWDQVSIGDFQISGLQALPKDAKPISLWGDRDDAFTDVAKGLLGRIKRLQQSLDKTADQSATASTTTVNDVLAADFSGSAEPAPELASWRKPSEEDVLESEKGIDYSKLRDLLKAGDWKAADYETYLRMLAIVGRQEDDWIRDSELLNFRCADLLTIDRLWMKYSQERFGFSVQKQIYVECGATLDGNYPGDKVWNKLGDKVGWRVNDKWISYLDVIFSTSAPPGHLPYLMMTFGGWVWSKAAVSFLLSHRDL